MESPFEAFAIVTVAICSTALLLNLTIFVANCLFVAKMPASSFLTFCMTIADSIAATCTLIVASAYLWNGGSEISPDACQVLGAIVTWSHAQTITLVTLLSYFRFFIVVYKTRLPNIVAYGGVLYMVFTMGIAVSIPFFAHDAADAFSLNATKVFCVFAWFGHHPLTRAISWTCIVGTLIPILSLGYVYYSIYKAVVQVNATVKESLEPMEKYEKHKSQSQVQSHQIKTDRSGMSITSEQKYEKMLLRQCVTIVSSFLITWSSYVLMMLIEVVTGYELPYEYEFFAQVLVSLNSLANPLIILVFDGTIRGNLIRCFTLCPRRNPA